MRLCWGIVDVEDAFLTQYALVDLQREHGEHHHTEQRQHDDLKQEAERLEQRRNDGLQTCSDQNRCRQRIFLYIHVCFGARRNQ